MVYFLPNGYDDTRRLSASYSRREKRIIILPPGRECIGIRECIVRS